MSDFTWDEIRKSLNLDENEEIRIVEHKPENMPEVATQIKVEEPIVEPQKAMFESTETVHRPTQIITAEPERVEYDQYDLGLMDFISHDMSVEKRNESIRNPYPTEFKISASENVQHTIHKVNQAIHDMGNNINNNINNNKENDYPMYSVQKNPTFKDKLVEKLIPNQETKKKTPEYVQDSADTKALKKYQEISNMKLDKSIDLKPKISEFNAYSKYIPKEPVKEPIKFEVKPEYIDEVEREDESQLHIAGMEESMHSHSKLDLQKPQVDADVKPEKLNNRKTVIITGASRGIGRAIATELADAGYNVVINYNQSKNEAIKLLTDIRAKGQIAEIYKADVSRRSDCKALVDFTISKFGNVDILINNAGIANEKQFQDITDEDFENIIATNLYSVFAMCQEALMTMLFKKKGCIINISSIYGTNGGSCAAAYSASKAGIDGLTKSLAKELGPSNIRVNSIAPGAMNTDMNKALTEKDWNELKEEIPMSKIGEGKDIAKCVKWLIEDDYTTGQVIKVDGGLEI